MKVDIIVNLVAVLILITMAMLLLATTLFIHLIIVLFAVASPKKVFSPVQYTNPEAIEPSTRW